MFIDIQKDSLISALQLVLRAVPSNNLLPILAGIHIEVRASEIIFTASNTRMTIQYRLTLDAPSLLIHRTGEIVVPARHFFEVVRKLGEGTMTLEIREGLDLTIVSSESRIRLRGMDPQEFPSIHSKDDHYRAKLRINNALLKSTIKQVAIAASSSEARPVLTGVLFNYNRDGLNLMATDGIRLATRKILIENDQDIDTTFLIPAQNLVEITKLLKNDTDTTEIVTYANQVRFTSNNVQIESVLIEGEFPSLSNVIPTSYISEVLLETNRLLNAVECVSVLASERVIKIAATKHNLLLFSQTADVGDVQHQVPFAQMKGDDFNFSLNVKLLVEILRSIGGGDVRLRFSGKLSPIMLIPEHTDPSTIFIITPVRTQ